MKSTLPWLITMNALCGISSAAVVNFDFGREPGETYAGLGAAPDDPGNTHWNNIRRTTSNDFSSAEIPINGAIEDSSNAPTSVSVVVSPLGLTNATIAESRITTGDQELGAAATYAALMGDWLAVNAQPAGPLGTANGSIGGLDSTYSYEIYFYGQGKLYGTTGDANSGQNSLFAITDTLGGSVLGMAKQTGWDGTDGGNGVLTEGVEYVKFLVTPKTGGFVFFRWQNVVAGLNVETDLAPDSSGGSSVYGALNAIQIVQLPKVAVPEPSTALLGGLSVLGLLARRRR